MCPNSIHRDEITPLFPRSILMQLTPKPLPRLSHLLGINSPLSTKALNGPIVPTLSITDKDAHVASFWDRLEIQEQELSHVVTLSDRPEGYPTRNKPGV
jgi:hypothetical protein